MKTILLSYQFHTDARMAKHRIIDFCTDPSEWKYADNYVLKIWVIITNIMDFINHVSYDGPSLIIDDTAYGSIRLKQMDCDETIMDIIFPAYRIPSWAHLRTKIREKPPSFKMIRNMLEHARNAIVNYERNKPYPTEYLLMENKQ